MVLPNRSDVPFSYRSIIAQKEKDFGGRYGIVRRKAPLDVHEKGPPEGAVGGAFFQSRRFRQSQRADMADTPRERRVTTAKPLGDS